MGKLSSCSASLVENLRVLVRPGPTTIRARATDLAGRAQLESPEWNRLGYGNNAIQGVTLQVRDR